MQAATVLTLCSPFISCRRFSHFTLHVLNRSSTDLLALYNAIQHLPSLNVPVHVAELTIERLDGSVSDAADASHTWETSLLAPDAGADELPPCLTALRSLTLLEVILSSHTLRHMEMLTCLHSLVVWNVLERHTQQNYASMFAAIERMPSLRRLQLCPMYGRDELDTLPLNFIAPYTARLTQLTALRISAIFPPMSALQHLASLTGLQSLEIDGLDFSKPMASPDHLGFISRLTNLTDLSIIQVANRQPQHGPPLRIYSSCLRSLERLQQLSVSIWTSADVEAVARCKSLTHLEMLFAMDDYSPDSGLEFDALGALKKLRVLILHEFPCDGEAMEAIVEALPKLETVVLMERGGLRGRQHNCPVVGHIASLKNLTQLDLVEVPVNAKALRRLSFRTGLTRLKLDRMVVSRAILQEIAAIKALEVVDIGECMIDGGPSAFDDIKILAQLPKLQCVFIPGLGAHAAKTAITKQQLLEA